MQPLRFSWAMRELPGCSQPSQPPQVLGSPSSLLLLCPPVCSPFFFLSNFIYCLFLFLFFFNWIQDCELRNQDFGLGRGSLVFSLCLLEGLTVLLWALVSQKSPVVRPGSRGQSPSPPAASS